MKTNLRALEGAGFEHLYGIAPVLNALVANTRDFQNPEDLVDMDLLEGDELEHELRQRKRKAEAKFAPCLFVQESGEGGSGTRRSADKLKAASEIESRAKEIGVPVAQVDKGVLNTLCGSRPHQGYVLRCGTMDFESLSRLPPPGEIDEDGNRSPSLWLALDEVVDPQNFGALLRSAHFLGGGGSCGVIVCSKNSSPPSPVASAASAGALEVATVYSASNLPKILRAAGEDGYRVLGAAASAPENYGGDEEEVPSVVDLNEAGVFDDSTGEAIPTVVVLGSEGRGLRTLVARTCSGFIRIPGGGGDNDDGSSAGVDSLNVSVTGGIVLWHFLMGGGGGSATTTKW